MVDRLKSARGIPLHSDPDLAEDQLAQIRAQVRPLVAVTVAFECQRLLGTHQNRVRLADVDEWLKITAAEGAKPQQDRKRGRLGPG